MRGTHTSLNESPCFALMRVLRSPNGVPTWSIWTRAAASWGRRRSRHDRAAAARVLVHNETRHRRCLVLGVLLFAAPLAAQNPTPPDTNRARTDSALARAQFVTTRSARGLRSRRAAPFLRSSSCPAGVRRGSTANVTAGVFITSRRSPPRWLWKSSWQLSYAEERTGT